MFEELPWPMRVTRYRCVPGEKVLWHCHDFVEWAWIASGRGLHWTLAGEQPVARGQWVGLAPYVHHGYYSSHEDPLVIVNVLWDPLWLRQLRVGFEYSDREEAATVRGLLEDSSRMTFQVACAPSEHQLIDSLLAFLEGELAQTADALDTLPLAVALLFALAQIIGRRVAKERGTRRACDPRVDRVREYIERHATEPLKLESLCQMAGLSRTALSQKFKALTGQSVMAYRNICRIRLAQRLLSSTNLSVTEVAFQSGFGDLHFFYLQFRLWTGCTPAQYRKNHPRAQP
jgi:AraC-like DNA-binding protein